MARVDFIHFALDSDPHALGLLAAALPVFGAAPALFGAWLSFRHHG